MTDQNFPAEDEELTAQEDNPGDIPDSDDPPTYGKNNREIPQQLKDAIGSIIKASQARDMYDRRIEVLMDRILRFYDDSVQHIYPTSARASIRLVSLAGTSTWVVGVRSNALSTWELTTSSVPEEGL